MSFANIFRTRARAGQKRIVVPIPVPKPSTPRQTGNATAYLPEVFPTNLTRARRPMRF